MKTKLTAWIAVLVMLLSFTGCSFAEIDVDGRLRAPHAVGEQSAIQAALEQHIFMNPDASAGTYVLKYPKMGDYRSAFVMKDVTGDKQEEALAFYALQPEGAKTHIALLSKASGEWVCIDDIEGLATEIERIQFGDLDNDGVVELFAGFSMYNTRDRRLMMYTWSDDHFVERYSDTYTNMIVDKVIDKTHDGLLLFRLNAKTAQTTVSLFTMVDDTVTELGSASLDGHISQFGKYELASFENGRVGVFQDCKKDYRATITELIIWNGQQLLTPLYDPAENINFVSSRESGLPSMDIDGNGMIDFPQSFRMPGYELVETENMNLWMSEWFTWDMKAMNVTSVMTTIMVPSDGYYITIPDDWIGNVSADYNAETRRLTVREVEAGVVGEKLFEIVAFGVNAENPFKEQDTYLFLESGKKTRYELCYDKENDLELTKEQLSGLFSLCDVPKD
ncbi:MAG: hypothetical protein E7553_01275 [Ruminococcaceae bacterium]|nr:hypothetical protein [Oscillospiraceae bacterium]